MKQFILLIIIFFLTTGVKCSMEKLDLERKDYLEDKIRLDGFYYSKQDFKKFFLYKNGIIFNGGSGFNDVSTVDIVNYYKDSINYKNCYILPYYWGVFQIDNKNNIIIESWVSGDAFGRYTTIKFTGDIFNDTTIILNIPVVYSTVRKPKEYRTDTFYFHKFNPKPDSTNIFIE